MLEAAGLLIWAVVGLPALIRFVRHPGALSEPASLAWLVLYGGWALAFRTATLPGAWPALGARRACLAFQAAAALAMAYWQRGLSEGSLLVVVAGELPFLLAPAAAVWWMLGQSVALSAILWLRLPSSYAAAVSAGYLAFQAFALGMSRATASEAEARSELARVPAELTAAQDRLQKASRDEERLRISRELHDTLGHHLTALSLNLEVAGHLLPPEAPAAEHVRRAHAVAHLLLGDLRDVVGTLRDDTHVDLAAALRETAQGIDRPTIHLEWPDGLEVHEPDHAQVILRCVQEAITNAVRHAGAANLWIEVTSTDGGMEVRARDDGHGVSRLCPGNGLTGMRERLEQAGGRLDLETHPGRGFEVRAWLPPAGARR